jgi:hypothetical protein
LRTGGEDEPFAGHPLPPHARPEHDVTVALVSRAILLDEDLLDRAASAPALPAELARWMLQRAA